MEPQQKNKKVYVVVSYDPDDHHSPNIIGVYSKRRKAYDTIFAVLKQEFDNMGKGDIDILINGEYSENDSDYGEDVDERFKGLDPNKVTWADIKTIIEKELSKDDETQGLGVDCYACWERIIDKHY